MEIKFSFTYYNRFSTHLINDLNKCSNKGRLNEASTIADKKHNASSSFPAQGLVQFRSNIFVLKLIS